MPTQYQTMNRVEGTAEEPLKRRGEFSPPHTYPFNWQEFRAWQKEISKNKSFNTIANR